MIHYVVKPVDGSPPLDIIAADASEVITTLSTVDCAEVDVETDGEYAFSLQLNEAGFWKIFDR